MYFIIGKKYLKDVSLNDLTLNFAGCRTSPGETAGVAVGHSMTNQHLKKKNAAHPSQICIKLGLIETVSV